MVRTIFFTILFLIPYFYSAQTVEDNFEGNGTISWQLDPTQIIMIDVNFSNPFQNGINNSSTVLKYDDDGSAPYANIRFNTPANFDLSAHNTFSLKIYIMEELTLEYILKNKFTAITLSASVHQGTEYPETEKYLDIFKTNFPSS